MTLHRLWQRFVAPRTTLALLLLVALACGLLVLVPQRRVVGAATFDALVEASRFNRLVLVDLGLGALPSSPLFVTVLALFFVNLAAVLVARVAPTFARVAPRPRSERDLVAWARQQESLALPLPPGFAAAHVADVLRDAGYRPRHTGERAVWGVRHRTAPLGFLLFHGAFFLVAAGGAAIWATRFEGTVILSEGQSVAGRWTSVERQPRLGSVPDLALTLLEVDPRLVGTDTVHLGTRLAVGTPGAAGGGRELATRINGPAQWGSATLLVNRAGLAPVLWLQDAAGFTLDRVTVPAPSPSAAPTELELAGGTFRLRVHPLAPQEPFPARDRRDAAPLRFQLRSAAGEPLGEGALVVGRALAVPGARLVLEEMRYWAEVKVVAERGGGLLVAGFAAGIVGVTWRLLFYRREVAVTWDATGVRVVGRSEYASGRFRDELAALRDALATGTAASPRLLPAVQEATPT